MVCGGKSGGWWTLWQAGEGLAPQGVSRAEVQEEDLRMEGKGVLTGAHLVKTAPTPEDAILPEEGGRRRHSHLSVKAGSVLNDHGQGIWFVVAEDRFSERRRGELTGVSRDQGGRGTWTPRVGSTQDECQASSPRPRKPGYTQGCLVPQDLGHAQGPPGCELLTVQQHAGLRAHEQQVLAAFPWHVHQVVHSPGAVG